MNQKERKINRVKDAQIITKEIYLYFLQYFQKHGYSPSYSEIAEKLNISQRTVQNHVTELIERGLLATDHPGNSRAVRVAGYKFVKAKEKTV